MRVTNSMIANSSRIHIGNAKNKLLEAEEQYTSEKKIQRPSDDPTIASRALKFRTTMSRLDQYAEKNVNDAMEWMDATEKAMASVGNALTYMKPYLSQGANSYPEAKERAAILAQLREYAKGAFEDNANKDYAGRYLFTGYRTDTSLLFPNDTDNLEYQIKENFAATDIDLIRNVTTNIAYQDGASDRDYAAMEAKINNCYRMQLAYDNCSDSAINGQTTVFDFAITYQDDDGTGNIVTMTDHYDIAAGNVAAVSSKDPLAYDIEEYNKQNGTSYDALYIYDAGEIVLSKDLYGKIQEKNAEISVDYTKKEFDKSDIRPEMYFQCTRYDTISMKTVQFADPSGQELRYEINFNQNMTVNTQARDAFSTEIYRSLDYIERTLADMDDVERRISEAEKRLANTTDPDEQEALKILCESLEEEKKLRVDIMNDAFGMGLTMVDTTERIVNVATAELGAKYNRLQMTYDRLLEERTDTEERLSNNEDMDIADAIINMTQADNLYNASLSATAKILGNSLLDYI